jgi:hypothetical protein
VQVAGGVHAEAGGHGVEEGRLELHQPGEVTSHDSSTNGLINHVKKGAAWLG